MAADLNAEEDAMCHRLIVLATLTAILVSAPPAHAVTITFETRPDGSEIRDGGPFTCGEISPEAFRDWGVLLTPVPGDTLNILPTLGECLSVPNALGLCSQNGELNITFVPAWHGHEHRRERHRPRNDDRDAAALVRGHQYVRRRGGSSDSWVLPHTGFCREPPAYYDYYHFSAPGRIARVECTFQYTFIDDLIVTEASTPVDGSTWGRIKAFYP